MNEKDIDLNTEDILGEEFFKKGLKNLEETSDKFKKSNDFDQILVCLKVIDRIDERRREESAERILGLARTEAIKRIESIVKRLDENE